MDFPYWEVRLSAEAKRDFQGILRWTAKTFGTHQARAYRDLLKRAINDLSRDGPLLLGSQARDKIGTGIRTLHIAKYGGRGRHLLLYRVADVHLLEIGRILHERMELRRHLPDAIDGSDMEPDA